MYCKDCKFFHIRQEPLPHKTDAGLAQCWKHGLSCEFLSNKQLSRLECVEGSDGRKAERCWNCRHFHKMKHNFKTGIGFEESYACNVLLNGGEGEGWIQETSPDYMCEMFSAADSGSQKERNEWEGGRK